MPVMCSSCSSVTSRTRSRSIRRRAKSSSRGHLSRTRHSEATRRERPDSTFTKSSGRPPWRNVSAVTDIWRHDSTRLAPSPSAIRHSLRRPPISPHRIRILADKRGDLLVVTGDTHASAERRRKGHRWRRASETRGPAMAPFHVATPSRPAPCQPWSAPRRGPSSTRPHRLSRR